MSAIDETHDPSLKSWIAGANGHPDFPVQNLPLGVFSPPGEPARIGTAIGDKILDLSAAASLLPEAVSPALSHPTLNALFALSPADRVALRRRLSRLLIDEGYSAFLEPLLSAAAECTLHLPCAIGDYTDFYVGINHATNIGKQFRPDNPLLPNYKWVPIGYHGRASSVRPSGDPVIRPKGQRKPPNTEVPDYGPTRRLDYELELGVWIAQGNPLGEPIAIGDAPTHIAGLSLLNDWSARDLQAWEYQPLGPFLSKDFHSTISPWVITAEALAPFRVAQPVRPADDPKPLPYLWNEADQASGAFAIDLAAYLSSAAMREASQPPMRISHGPTTSMYWTVAQMVTHHASNGCDLRPGDLLGSGTISACTDDGLGSLMEMTLGGSRPLTLPTGETRTFLEDGDELTLGATAHADGFAPIGFGPCRATILPAVAASR